MRIAAFQRYALYDDVERVCDMVEQDVEWAASEGVGIALFPEAFLLGHSYDPAVLARRATRVSGYALDALCSRVARLVPTLVIGAFARDEDAIVNSAFVIEQGRVVGRYDKAHPNEPGVTAGSSFPVFRRDALRYGIAICNDANHAEPAQRLADGGAALILYPLNNMLPPSTADRWRSRSIANLQARARQTGCWIASADVTGGQAGRVSHGCTAIVSPDGAIVARAEEGREAVAIFDLP